MSMTQSSIAFSLLLLFFFFFYIEEHTCKDFRCSTKEFCISPDLLCDNVNHCEDGSDEAIGTLCEGNILFLKLPPIGIDGMRRNVNL